MRKIIHPLIRALAPMTGHYILKIVRKEQMPKHAPIIFAATHSFKDDLLHKGEKRNNDANRREPHNDEIRTVATGEQCAGIAL